MRRYSSGQVALILVLILTVVSSVALSTVSGVITNIRLTGVDQESSQALRVAEAGVEEALRTLSSGGGTLGGINYNVTFQDEGVNGFVTEEDIVPGDVLEVTLTSPSNRPTSIDIYWQDTDDAVESPVGAIEVIAYRWQSVPQIEAIHSFYDSNTTRAAANGFTVPSGASTYRSVNFGAKQNISFDWKTRMIRIKVLYNQQKIGIGVNPGTASLGVTPYRRVVSQATNDSGVTRKVEAVRTEGALPAVFDAALYSGGSLSQ